MHDKVDAAKFSRGALRDYLFQHGCKYCGRRGRSKIIQNAGKSRRTSFPRRPMLLAADVRRICVRLGVPMPEWLPEKT